MKKREHPQRPVRKSFHLEFLNTAQKMAWAVFEQNDILFLLGPAGTAKTHLAIGFAISEVLAKRKSKIVLTRPVVEAGENLGFLPGTFAEKIHPYLLPIFDCITKLVGPEGPEREKINKCLEIAPIAYLRGRTFDDSVCILDEAQNAKEAQLKLFLTRMGQDSKLIITGDPGQSDLPMRDQALASRVAKLKKVHGIGFVEFNESAIVRHPLVAKILESWDDDGGN